MNFFFDNNMPPHSWVDGIAALSRQAPFASGRVQEVVHIRDKFKGNTDDLEWIPTLGTQGQWTVISRDSFRKRNGAERKAIRQYGLSVFVLQKSWTNKPYWELTAQFIHWWPRIVEQACAIERVTLEVPWRTSGKFMQI
ncbi:MAG: hypothetical protein LBE78_07735 [Burkholderiaceae bacterium]|nr:hypothetical protein [Burkholderiaceae bacterium]